MKSSGKENVADLMGAEARAILKAVETCTAKVELQANALVTLEGRVEKMERAGWAARDAAVGAKETAKGAKEGLEGRMTKLEESNAKLSTAVDNLATTTKALEINHNGLADRTAAEIIRLTIGQKRQAGDAAVKLASQARRSRPDGDTELEEAAKVVRAGDHIQVRGPLPSLGDYGDEDTGKVIIKRFIERAEKDANFQREAAHAGVGLRVETWKTALKWITAIVASATAGGALWEWAKQLIAR